LTNSQQLADNESQLGELETGFIAGFHGTGFEMTQANARAVQRVGRLAGKSGHSKEQEDEMVL
jgi:hypothetical protein